MYERVGGAAWFDALTQRFYELVADDPIIRPLYPDDLEPGRRHLRDFLIQYWGGPSDYGQVRGHPRLRVRHAPFIIGEPERDAWLRHMAAAVVSAGLADEDEAEMLAYFEMASSHLING